MGAISDSRDGAGRQMCLGLCRMGQGSFTARLRGVFGRNDITKLGNSSSTLPRSASASIDLVPGSFRLHEVSSDSQAD